MRVSLGAVFLAFGIGKFQHDIWARTIENMPVFMHLPWNVALTVRLIGGMEVVTGVLLIAGIWTRVAAAVAAAQLAAILILLQFQETRDIGLLGQALFLALNKEMPLRLGALFRKK